MLVVKARDRLTPEMKRPTAKKKSRRWTKEDVQMLKTMVREKTKISVIARKLKRTERATQQKASTLGVKLARASHISGRERHKAGRRSLPGKTGVMRCDQFDISTDFRPVGCTTGRYGWAAPENGYRRLNPQRDRNRWRYSRHTARAQGLLGRTHRRCFELAPRREQPNTRNWRPRL